MILGCKKLWSIFVVFGFFSLLFLLPCLGEGKKDNLNSIAQYRIPYSVNIKLTLLSSHGGIPKDGPIRDLVILDFINDLVYLNYLAKFKDGDYAEAVRRKIAFGFVEGYLDKSDYFNDGSVIEVISPEDSEVGVKISPKDFLDLEEISQEERLIYKKYYEKFFRKKGDEED